ncbi:putative ammonium transporter 1 isoform X2 [Lineus longissimus]|uniref:putative ammonium transporter 1 isoform X2 n=1 Tax=Lineus longissimus TaxID=88925 RepID=UPI00315CD3FB
MSSAVDPAQLLDMVSLKLNVNIFFVTILAAIVLFMQCGYALLEAGSVRSKNATNIVIKGLLCTVISVLVFWGMGYAFAHGPGNFFLGWRYFFGESMPEILNSHWLWHTVLAVTASSIASSSMAGRCEFYAYPLMTFLITGVIFPFISHWCWHPDGWLKLGTKDGVGYEDFAGSGVVHVLGGTAAWVAAILLGPRRGKFIKDSRKTHNIPGHSSPLSALGGFILIFGLLAFNGGAKGSITEAGDGQILIRAVMNTVLSGMAAAMAAVITKKIAHTLSQHCCRGTDPGWTLQTLINSTLTGMVAIGACADVLYPWGAAAVGWMAGWAYIAWSMFLMEIKVDDPMNTVAVHLGGGLWGVIARPLLKMNTGIVFVANKNSFLGFAWNVAGAASIIGWTAGILLLVLGTVRLMGLLRVTEGVESKGLDVLQHHEPAYPEQIVGDEAESEMGDEKAIISQNGHVNGLDFMGPHLHRQPSTTRNTPELGRDRYRQSGRSRHHDNSGLGGYDNPTFDHTTMF